MRHALAEPMIGLNTTELVHRNGQWRDLSDLELGMLEWVDWFNRCQLFNTIDMYRR